MKKILLMLCLSVQLMWAEGYRGLSSIKSTEDYYELDCAIDYVVEAIYPNNPAMQAAFTEELIKHITGEYSSWISSRPEILASGIAAVDAYIAGSRRLKAENKHVRGK